MKRIKKPLKSMAPWIKAFEPFKRVTKPVTTTIRLESRQLEFVRKFNLNLSQICRVAIDKEIKRRSKE